MIDRSTETKIELVNKSGKNWEIVTGRLKEGEKNTPRINVRCYGELKKDCNYSVSWMNKRHFLGTYRAVGYTGHLTWEKVSAWIVNLAVDDLRVNMDRKGVGKHYEGLMDTVEIAAEELE